MSVPRSLRSSNSIFISESTPQKALIRPCDERLKSGREITIKGLTELVAEIVGYSGGISWDTSRPNGTPRKVMDISKAASLGWKAHTSLRDGIRLAYEDFKHRYA